GTGASLAATPAHLQDVGRRLPHGHLRHLARRAPLGWRRMEPGHAFDQPGPDQPDRGLERAGRAGLGHRLAPRPARVVAGRCGADGRGPGQAGVRRSPAPGQPAGHRLVHRLWPAVHAGRLFRARAAAHRQRGRLHMKHLAWIALLPLAAFAGVRDDYAQQWPLALSNADAGAYRVVLDRTVYRQLQSPDLKDLMVVNADGVAVAAPLFDA